MAKQDTQACTKLKQTSLVLVGTVEQGIEVMQEYRITILLTQDILESYAFTRFRKHLENIYGQIRGYACLV